MSEGCLDRTGGHHQLRSRLRMGAGIDDGVNFGRSSARSSLIA
jgi:hypothetical protein